VNNQEFTEDPRYRVAAKEAWMAITLFLLNFCWWFVFAYGLGDQPPFEYSYVFGFPAWFFWSVIVGSALFCALAYIMVRYFYTDMPLGPDPNGSAADERR
jgi:uncharacterized membrane protein YhdT